MTGQTLDLKTAINGNQWKTMLPFSINQGVLHSDDKVEVTCVIQVMKFLERIQLAFTAKGGASITEVQAKLTQNNDSLDIAVSPMKIKADGVTPEIIIMAMLKEPIVTSPSLRVQCQTSTGNHLCEFRLPIFLSKLTEPVEMPAEIFKKTWDDITHNRPQTFQKVDTMIKNPAPLSVPHTEVLKKLANFFSSSMNLKVYSPEDPSNFWSVKAVGQVNFKPPN
jgi:hypothetical protein